MSLLLFIFVESLKKFTVLPYVNPFTFDGEANSGDSVQLMCHVSKGDLPIIIKWLFNGQVITSQLGIISTKIGDRSNVLAVPSVGALNGGIYTCLASNAAGQFNHSTELFVNGTTRKSLLYFLLVVYFVLFSFFTFNLSIPIFTSFVQLSQS